MQYDLLTDEGFEAYVDSIDERLLATSEGRRSLTEVSPLAFALIYFPEHLRGDSTGGKVSFSDLHIALIEQAEQWVIKPTAPRQNRDAYIAPRDNGKSTWLFFILPMWAAAHGHLKFICAFADTGPQALIHLGTFKRALQNNELLRQDYPELCTAARKEGGQTQFDTKNEYRAESGFTFVVRGADTGVLGIKFDEVRPDLLIIDDFEPLAKYTIYQAEQRLEILQTGILALNEFARCVISGTVTIVGSVIHQLVKTSTEPHEEHPTWIAEQNIRVHHFKPIIVDPETGLERSTWPAKWPMEYMEKYRHTKVFRKNMANDPMAAEGDYWNEEDILHQELINCTKTLLSVDPFVKNKSTSDPCGLAVISYLPKKILNPNRASHELARVRPPKCMVEYADDCRKTGSALREKVIEILQVYPHIGRVYVEDNQGGDLWKDILKDLPVKLICEPNTVDKNVRAGQLHVMYQRGQVVHAAKFGKAEEQMVGFKGKDAPGQHDDIIDAIGNGVFKFIKPDKKPRGGVDQISYA